MCSQGDKLNSHYISVRDSAAPTRRVSEAALAYASGWCSGITKSSHVISLIRARLPIKVILKARPHPPLTRAPMRLPPARTIGITLFLLAMPTCAAAADWPMWRYDPQRTATSPQQLPAQLHLQWAREYPALTPAWPDQDKMPFDIAYEPVVCGHALLLSSSRHDCVRCLDTRTGEERWTFHADGPVRFAPAAWEGRLFVAADDGYLYCLDAASGKELWKFRCGPSDRKILGNERRISTSP